VVKINENWELSPGFASAPAVEFLQDPFFWELTNETSPFGNSYGADSLMGFIEWRKANPKTRVFEFAISEIESYGFDADNLDFCSEDEVISLIKQYKLDPFAQDWIIIAVALGQFILEGNVDSDLLAQAIVSTDRQKMTTILDFWSLGHRKERAKKLEVISDKLIKLQATVIDSSD